jgi:tetratricopeptide (TPR) repeat protein
MDVEDATRAGLSAEADGDLVGATAAFASLIGHSDLRVVADAKLHLGRIAWKQTQVEAARAYCEDARAIAMRLGDPDLRARVENAMGVLHVARAEYAQARAAYGVALELTKDPVTRAKITLNLGVIANIQGALELARRHYQQSLALYREAGDEAGEALALHNVGMMHLDLAEWDEADEAFGAAIALFEAQRNRQMIASVLMNRSEVTYARGRTQEAIAQCDMALATYAEIGDEVGRGEALRLKGHGLRLLGRHQAAVHALTEAIRIAQRTHTRLLEAEATRELGKVYKADNRPKEARNQFTRALAMFTNLGAKRDAEELSAELAKTGEGGGGA